MSIVCLLDTLNDLVFFSNIISPIAIIIILSVSTLNHDEPSELSVLLVVCYPGNALEGESCSLYSHIELTQHVELGNAFSSVRQGK